MSRIRLMNVRHGKRKGFVLLLFAAVAILATAIVGLAFDLGRLYVAKAELQAYADAAAIFAATKLDGTRDGIDRANSAAAVGPLGSTSPNKVNLADETISNVAVRFATAYNGTWDSSATARTSSTNSYRFVRVTTTAASKLYFLPIVNVLANASNTVGYSHTLSAVATGGQRATATVTNGGLVPFSPDAHDAAETRNFGFTPGVRYTFKWGNGNTTTCEGDIGFSPGNAPSEHGFVDLGQGNSNSLLREAITYSTYPKPDDPPVTVGTRLEVVPGNRGSSIFGALADRSLQDPDQESTTYAEYLARGIGNGRRVVSAAINDPWTSSGSGSNRASSVVGFGSFLIDPASAIDGSSGPICATYIGPAAKYVGSSGGTDGTKIYEVKLYQ